MFSQQVETKQATGGSARTGDGDIVDLPALPLLRGSDGGIFRTIDYPDDQAMAVDIAVVLAADPRASADAERIYLIRKFQAAYLAGTGKPDLQHRLAQVIRHLYVEGVGVVVDPTLTRQVHVPDLTDYDREFRILDLREQYNATTDLFARDKIEQALKHLRDIADGPAAAQTRAQIKQLIAGLTTPPVGVGTPTFQALLQSTLDEDVKAPLTSAELASLRTRVQRFADIVARHPGTDAAAKAAIFDELVQARAAADVPAANRYGQDVPVIHGSYTVGGTRTVWVSPRGAAAGQDVLGWQPVSDLNYKYDLVHADKRKLCAAHLLPALLGGRKEDANLVPAANEANGWLAANPERHAKEIVFSAGECVQYEVTCTFARQVNAPLEADVAALVPSAITVTVTRLSRVGHGDPTDWQHYQPTGQPRVFAVPADRLLLDVARMAAGVQRVDLDRSKLNHGMA
jgi:hypothetical protein